MNAQLLMKISLIIDKMEIANDIMNIDRSSNEEVGRALIALIISKMYKAENEIYEVIAEYKSISVEEAKKTEIIPILKDLLKLKDVKDFLS